MGNKIGTTKRLSINEDNPIGLMLAAKEEEWENCIKKLYLADKIDEDEMEDFLYGNFAAAYLVWKNKNTIQFETIYAASRISYKSQHDKLNHPETEDFYKFLQYHKDIDDLHYNYISVNKKRDITQGRGRFNDTEAKIIESVRNKVISKPDSKIISFDLYTSLEPCLSCDYAIIQLLEEYSDLSINLYSKWSYNETIYPRKEK